MPTTTTITKTCPLCGKLSEVTVLTADFVAWKNAGDNDPKRHAQVAFPEMLPEDREILISGTHASCWDEMFPDEGDFVD